MMYINSSRVWMYKVVVGRDSLGDNDTLEDDGETQQELVRAGHAAPQHWSPERGEQDHVFTRSVLLEE